VWRLKEIAVVSKNFIKLETLDTLIRKQQFVPLSMELKNSIAPLALPYEVFAEHRIHFCCRYRWGDCLASAK
jgi:hypothetical protein